MLIGKALFIKICPGCREGVLQEYSSWTGMTLKIYYMEFREFLAVPLCDVWWCELFTRQWIPGVSTAFRTFSKMAQNPVEYFDSASV